MARWREVTAENPCPACGGVDWCAWTPDGAMLKCERSTAVPCGMTYMRDKDGGGLFRAACGTDPRRLAVPAIRESNVAIHFDDEARRFALALNSERLKELARTLAVRPDALQAIGVGWATADDLHRLRVGGAGWSGQYPTGAYAFPERDGTGRLVGFCFRTTDGRKGAPSRRIGAHRGLIVPSSLAERADPVLVVEGASDVAACETLGLAAIGRPSNAAGAEQIARLLKGRVILVVGERDQKPDGRWPGRDGAERVAVRVASEWGRAVAWTLPPATVKDVRAWLHQRAAAGLDLSDADACWAAGVELLQVLGAAAEEARPEARPRQSELLVRLALERYRLGRDEAGEPFAVERDGPNVALMFRGSRDALRPALARGYRRRYGTTPNASALADALTVLQGEAQERSPEPVHLRVARHEHGIVLDFGDDDGQAVIIRPGGWQTVDRSPVLFRRTALTGQLPKPQRGGELQLLRELLNVSDESWPLVLGWLVAAFLPAIPHPILLLGGLQGSGKTTTARMLVEVFDPSPAVLRSPPKEPEQWAIAAAGSWGVLVDNISSIAAWWSDALCKVVSGDGWIRRKLYTDADHAVLSFRRVIALTSTDPGSLRGDLGDRLLLVELDEINDADRKDESLLVESYRQRHASILGAVLDLLANVLQCLPRVNLETRPRMADFARVQAAVDAVLGPNGLGRYAEKLRDDIREFLRRECGLELSVDKTHVTHVQDGYDFLGFRLSHEIGQGGKRVPKIKVGLKALRNVKQRLHDAMRNRPHQESVALRLQRGSAVVRGWSEYFRIAHNFTDLAGTLDHHALWIALKGICRKLDIPTGTAMKRFYRRGVLQVDEACRLETFSGIPMKLDYRGPEPYMPGQGSYDTDDDMEADFTRFCEGQRLGGWDVKYRALQRDGYCCRACGKRVTDQSSQVDHIVPVNRFASFALASTDDNVQTLCLDCHREKHSA